MKASSAILFVFLSAILVLSGCSRSSSLPEVTGPPGNGGNGNGGNGNGGTPTPTPISEITDLNAVLLARSVMAMTGGIAAIGEITTEMVRKGTALLADPNRQPGDAIGLQECNELIEPGPSTNQLSYEVFSAGFQLPGGDRLQAAFTECTIENLLVQGTLHITTVTFNGDPSHATADWSFEARVFPSPLEFLNENGTLTSFLPRFRYKAVKSAGVLTIDLVADAEPSAGQDGGLNAQHHLLAYIENNAINYQFRPYRVTIVDDSHSKEYRIIIQAHADDGNSLLNRYTQSPSGDITLTVSTTAGLPITWAGGKPGSYLDVPASGELKLVTGSDSVTAAVESGAVVLTVSVNGTVTTPPVSWEELLAVPES